MNLIFFFRSCLNSYLIKRKLPKMSEELKVEIEYCGSWGYEPRYKELANVITVKWNLLKTFLFGLPMSFSSHFRNLYLAHVIEKPNLRIPNPQYFLLFKWKFDHFFIRFEFDRGDKKTKCIHKSNVIKKIVVNIGDSEFVNLVFRWREQDIQFDIFYSNFIDFREKLNWYSNFFLLELAVFFFPMVNHSFTKNWGHPQGQQAWIVHDRMRNLLFQINK